MTSPALDQATDYTVANALLTARQVVSAESSRLLRKLAYGEYHDADLQRFRQLGEVINALQHAIRTERGQS